MSCRRPSSVRSTRPLVRWFVKRYVARRGVLAFGPAMPFGVGAVFGAVGNLAVARGVIRSTERAFGPPPGNWPDPVSPQQ